MSLVNRRSGILFFIGFFSILVTRIVFRTLRDVTPVISGSMIVTAIISAAIVALAFELVWQKRGQ